MGWVAANWLIGGQPPVPMGNDNFTAAPSGTFATQDGYINIAANQQEQWERCADVLGVPELKTDARFQKRDVRKANRHALTPLLEAKLQERPRPTGSDVLNRHRRARPATILDAAGGARLATQVAHRGIAPDDRRPTGIGDIKLFNLTAKFEKTPGAITAPPPRLGAHTDAVLPNGYAPATSRLRDAESCSRRTSRHTAPVAAASK